MLFNPRIKYTLKKYARPFGISRSNSVPPRRYKKDALEHLVQLGFKPGTVIDVGVADGTYDIYDVFPKAHFLLIEPMMEFEPALEFACRHFDAEYIIAAAGSSEGSIDIHVGPRLTTSTTLAKYTNDGHTEAKIRTVHQVTLDNVIYEKKLPEPFLLKVDVQGSELQVLEGSQNLLTHCAVIILETSLFTFQRDRPLFADVIQYMKERGFAVYDLVDGMTRPLDGALAQIDVVFVQADGPFRKDDRWKHT